MMGPGQRESKVLRVARDQCVMQRPSKWAVVNHNDFRNGGYLLRFLVALEIEGPIDSVQHGLHSLKKQTKREGIMRRKQVQKQKIQIYRDIFTVSTFDPLTPCCWAMRTSASTFSGVLER